MTVLAFKPKPSVPVIPRDIHAYESEQRKHSAAKDWARLHIRGDKSPPINLPVNWKAPR